MGNCALGISEMRWPQSGRCNVEDHVVYYSGADDAQHRRGVGFVLTGEMDAAVVGFIPLTDRMAMLEIQADPVNISLIQVYAPTGESEEETVESFYTDLERLMKQRRKRNVTIVMGDWNAKVGNGRDGGVVGEYGLGSRNERGDRFVQFCRGNDLVIMNTFFKLPKRRLYTWRSPADAEHRVVGNQIDFLTIQQRFRNSVKWVKTFPGADISSDHNVLIAKLQIRLKRTKERRGIAKPDLNKIKDPIVGQALMEMIEEELQETNQERELDVEHEWTRLKQATNNAVKAQCGRNKPVKKKGWMTSEIIDVMEERRRYKNKDEEKYRELN